MECQQIIMNYTVPPSIYDIEAIAKSILGTLPDEMIHHVEDVILSVEDMADDVIQDDLGLDDPFELLIIYKNGKEMSPGIESKDATVEATLSLYRRAILDMWCEVEDDLVSIIRQAIIEEIGRCFEFSDDDVQEMLDRHYQGML